MSRRFLLWAFIIGNILFFLGVIKLVIIHYQF